LADFKIDGLVKIGYKKLTEKGWTQVSPFMDLKAASDQNSTIDRLTRAGMVTCFLATSALLISALTTEAHQDNSSSNFSLYPQLSSK